MARSPDQLLGRRVRDTVTGLEGVAIGHTTWLNACVRITIQPQEVKDGKPAETYSVDEEQIVVLQPTPLFFARNVGASKVTLGSKVRDLATGVEGVAIGRTVWPDSSRIIVQQPGVKDGKPFDTISVDEITVFVLEAKTVERERPQTGGPMPDPARRSEPSR